VQLRFKVYLTNLSLGLLINGQHYICNICRAIFLPFHLQNCENRFHMELVSGIVSYLSAFKLFLCWPSAFSNQSYAGWKKTSNPCICGTLRHISLQHQRWKKFQLPSWEKLSGGDSIVGKVTKWSVKKCIVTTG